MPSHETTATAAGGSVPAAHSVIFPFSRFSQLSDETRRAFEGGGGQSGTLLKSTKLHLVDMCKMLLEQISSLNLTFYCIDHC